MSNVSKTKKRASGRRKNAYQRTKFGPVAFWFLNHQLEKEELRRQVAAFKKKGFAGFFLHARSGLLTPYGSTAWFDALAHCIEEAKHLNLDAWLYDEDPYPSGMAGGQATLSNSEWRASHLHPTIQPIQSGGLQIMDLPRGQLLGVFLVQGERITRIDEHAGIVRTEWTQPRRESYGYYPPYIAEGSPHWRVTTLHPHFRISLNVKNRGGHLVAFVRQHASHHPWGEYADLLNPEAVAEFIRLTHRNYQSRFGQEFGGTIPGIFTDEPKTVGAFPWSKTLSPIFRSLTGMSLPEILPHLAMDIDESSAFLRWAYRESISRAFKTSYVDQIEQFCREAGLAFVGHVSPEEDPVAQAIYTPGLMDWIGGMTFPGSDLIGAEIGDERHKVLHLGQKLASSAAHTRGKRDVLCEAFAVVDWGQDMPWMGAAINWLYALGINMLTTHGQFYSIDGLRKREAPPSQFFQASYWEHFGGLTRYVENLSRELTQGRHDAPVAIYYPAEAFMADSPASSDGFILSETAKVRSERLRNHLAQTADLLMVNGYDFDFLDERALLKAKLKNGKLTLHEEDYRALILPGGQMTDSALKSVKSLEKDGFVVISLSPQIVSITGKPHRSRLTATRDTILQKLRKYSLPVFRADGGRLIGHKRIYAGKSSIFLVNNGDLAFKGSVSLDFPGPYVVLDLQTGHCTSIDEPMRLDIEPRRGILIRQQAHPKISPRYRNPRDWRIEQDLSTEWTVRPVSENCLLLSEFRMMAFSPEDLALDNRVNERFVVADQVNLVDPPNTGVRLPSTTTAYWTTFECRGGDMSLYLVRDSQLGPPSTYEQSKNFRFFLNGKPIRNFRRKQRYDSYNIEAKIDNLVQEGRNILVMEQTLPSDWPLNEGLPYDGLRIFGDFHVEFARGHSAPARLTKRPAAYNIGAPAILQPLGHPHYGGLAIYSRTVNLKMITARSALRFDRLHESAEIFVNGSSAGILWQPPHLLEIPSRLWRVGHNVIEVHCSTSPANYLQGLCRPSGFSGPVQLVST